VKNDSETDVDCGGALLTGGAANPKSDGAPACAAGKTCSIGSDCTTGVCSTGPVLVDNLDGGHFEGGSDNGSTLVCQPATPYDGVKNDSETDVDCGGSLLASGQPNGASDGAPACAAGKKCGLASDCQSLVCTAGVCAAPTATDGIQNDSETDVDCGGGLLASGAPNPSSDGAPACGTTKKCKLGTDCLNLVCAPSAVMDGGVSLDGGPIDCASGESCTCQPPTDTDGVKNDSETDVDCGGGFLAGMVANMASDRAPVCQLGQSCTLGTDCFAGVCNDNSGMGGPPADCPAGDKCQCQAPSSTDGVKNGGETDVDCGGGTTAGSDSAPKCAAGKDCAIGSDCQSGVCGASKTCSLPTPTDGVQNGGETDVDCGGTPPGACTPTALHDCAPACVDAKTCAVGTDCLSTFCSAINKTCVDGLSCTGLIPAAPIQDLTTLASTALNGADAVGTPDPNGAGQSAGIDTCGAGESTDSPGLQSHESCCKSLPLPGLAACSPTAPCVAPAVCSSTTGPGTCQARMDKYEATAGRVRQFVESVKKAENGRYNIQAWVQTQLTMGTTAGQLIAQMMPTTGAGSVVPLLPTGDIVNDGVPTYLSVVAQLGGTILDAAYPSPEQGCYVASGAYGASTYWWPSDEEASVGTPPRAFTQDYYDVKPQNCAPYWIAAAFCAWDGGRLPTLAESYAIYSTTMSYPWSSAPAADQPVLFADSNGQPESGEANDLAQIADNMGVPITNYTVNWHNANLGASTDLGDFYFYPSWVLSNPTWAGMVDTLGDGSDLTPYISAPGRFTKDLTFKTALGGTEGWMDYGADMLEFLEVQSLTAQVANFCDTSDGVKPPCSGGYNCTGGGFCGVQRTTVPMPGSLWEGGSWEGHGIQQAGYNEPLFTQYGKAGFRCVRPPEAP
jgi:hypothetical protein